MLKKIFSFSNATLLVALSISTIAAYYSIIGLTAIFAGAVIPVVVMGSILEVGKITTTVWLRKYWHRAGWMLKLYLIPAVVALAFLTSMGIFGFLSKAHMDQGLTSGDVLSKISMYDEKIKTSRENIDANRKALKQLDEAVDQVMGRSSDEKGADKAVAIRRGQTKDRARLLQEISAEQKTISSLNEERAPIAAEVRKVEAEVGPIKYIAALLYGDNPDANVLERAVRWVIILIVVVFDPLAIALVLAANASKEWDNEESEVEPEVKVEPEVEPEPEVELEVVPEVVPEVDVVPEVVPEVVVIDPIVTVEEDEAFNQIEAVTVELPVKELSMEEQMADTVDTESKPIEFEGIKVPGTDEWIQTGPVFVQPISTASTYKEVGDGYVEFEGKKMSKRVLQSMRPDLFNLKEDDPREIEIGFGSSLPSMAKMGDTYIKTDSMPHVVYKNNGTKWIEINKLATGAYLSNTLYLQSLVESIANGVYDPDLLTDHEQDAIASYIKAN
jgi:hypothetical protein